MARSVFDRLLLAVLNLPPDATAPQIRGRYRTLVKVHHPDHGGSPRNLQRVVAAYHTLERRGRV